MKGTPLLIATLVLVTLSRALAGNTIACPTRTGNDTVEVAYSTFKSFPASKRLISLAISRLCQPHAIFPGQQ
jgi:hypothetical protein